MALTFVALAEAIFPLGTGLVVSSVGTGVTTGIGASTVIAGLAAALGKPD